MPERRVASDWTLVEVEATVADYFAMLAKELAREPLNKKAHNRALQDVLDGRSAAAIEFKHQNISAILIDLGYPYIEGYKPARNYQALLRDVVTERLAADRELTAVTAVAVSQPVGAVPQLLAWESVHVPPPIREGERTHLYERSAPRRTTVRGVNYLEREARNHSLGVAGEEYVLRLEHARLWASDARHLADRVEHASRTRGDGLGYDILSFETNGKERLIEVKTTRFGAMTPFFATANEVAVSEEASGHYHLYRLFKFEERPRLFVLPGSLRESVVLEPVAYRAALP